MTSSMNVQLTPGQRCLLDLLQRKLLNTIQSYAKLSLEKQPSGNSPDTEVELSRLKEKIRRISARQKRFTLEIINGNGNNTIPKETFFEALGLVTKEALSKLNSKTNERRRRTTANPRFSHEAIQAKRALEPLQKRLEPRVSRDKREASKKQPRNQSNTNNSNNANNNSNNNNNSSTSSSNNSTNDNADSINRVNNGSANNNISNTKNNPSNGKGNNIQQSIVNNNNNDATISSIRNNAATRFRERKIMKKQVDTFGYLRKQVIIRMEEVNNKRQSIKELEEFNEEIRRQGLDIMNAFANIRRNKKNDDDGGDNNDDNVHEENQVSQQPDASDLANDQSQTSEAPNLQSTDPTDAWIDFKCDESIDSLD